MEGFRHQGRPIYVRPTPETYAYQNLYGTVRTNPNGKVRPSLDFLDPGATTKNAANKKSFNFLPWRKKDKNRLTDEQTSTLSKHNKYKFGSVSALSTAGLYRDWDSTSLAYTPSYSSSDLKHASVKSVGGKVRGLVTYPWETYTPTSNDLRTTNGRTDVRNANNARQNKLDDGAIVEKTRDLSVSDVPRPLCKCQTKKTGPFGTLNLNSLKPSKCNCGFSSVRSSRGFAPPPPPRRKSILPEKVDLYAVHEDQVQMDPMFGGYRRKHENIYDTLSRHGKYRAAPSPPSVKAPTPAQSKFVQSIEKCKKDPYSSVASRKSILECDVTAYDLVKNYLKADSPSIDSDIDDDLSDNIIEGKKDKSYKSNKSPSPVSSESESGIYSQASSVRIGGHGMKVLHPNDGNNSPQLYSEGSKTNSVDSRTSSWSNSSLSDDGIYSLPEPDYDDVVIQDSDSVLRFSDASSLRKYPSGGYLDSMSSDFSKPGLNSRSSDYSQGHYDCPRFSTIRKATSMMSLVGSECGTLRGRPKIPSVPEIPSKSSIPPPPPPPPPPPNFSIKTSPTQLDSATLAKSRQALSQTPAKKPANSVASSIANELSEKLKSNRPILKKKEQVKKQPMSVNSHNPYAEVKSILKKTSVVDKTSSSSSAESSPKKLDLDLMVKKKKVQFKSLSNESLLSAASHLQKTLSSSSDEEEWEEARESFDSSSKTADSSSKPESEPARKVGFQTVGEFLKRKEDNGGDDVNRSKSDTKAPSKPTTIPRPTQPPPPPPNIRKGTTKGPPPPRPLATTPKSYSHSDLRTTAMPGLLRITAGKPAGGQQLAGKKIGLTVSDTSNQVKSDSTLPKNGPSSPAASPEATTSTRGKLAGDHSQSSPTDVATRISQFNEKFSLSAIDGGTKIHHQSNEKLSLSSLDGSTKIHQSNEKLSHSASDDDTKIQRSNENVTSTDGDTRINHLKNKLSFSEKDGSAKISQFNEKLSSKTIDDDTSKSQCNRECSVSPSDVATTMDDSSSESSYMSLLCDKNLICDHVSSTTEKYPDVNQSSGTSKIQTSNKKIQETKSFTCTFLNNTDSIASEKSSSKLFLGDNNLTINDESITANDDTSIISENELHRKPPDWSSCESLSTIPGPLYSSLLYVPLPSPTPPPLPATAPPPLPPKRSPNTRLSTIDGTTNKQQKLSNETGSHCYDDDNDSLYDVLPSVGVKKRDVSIYESRRYSDTGATVVCINAGAEDLVAPSGESNHIYCSVGGPIYEEVKDAKNNTSPLPNPFGRHRRSFFEGASKAEILRFLEGAKERVVLDHLEDDVMLEEYDDELPPCNSKNVRNNPIRISNISSSSDSSTVSSHSSSSGTLSRTKILGGAEVERADSGLGSETSKPSRRAPPPPEAELCADCDQQMSPPVLQGNGNCCPLVCGKCDKKRSERKEIVTEIVETEFKYGKDLLVIKEEFMTPMDVAGLLSKDHLAGIFLNLDELMSVNARFADKLRDATDIAQEQGDEDFTTVNIGKLFLETTTMLRAFEVYCVRQGSASLLLTQLEKERELLRIFLRVSQMENTLLRRMNLAAFLMVPVQRVTKYPLLLSRLYKVTPYHHQDREALREAQLKIELHLDHINQQTKGVSGTKIWRRISNISAGHRRNNSPVTDIGSIQLRKMALEVLEWSKEDIRFVLAGKLSFSCSGQLDFALARSRRRGQQVKFSPSHALLATKGRPNGQYRPDLAQDVMFPRNTGIQDAALMLMKEKNGRYSLARDPLFLGTCIISAELEDEDIIEIQEYTTKESIFLRAECRSDTLEWLKQLRYHAKDLGTWKRRRNALANIMINGMIRQQ